MQRDGCARVVVLSEDDAGTLPDCLDALAEQVGPGIDVLVADLDSHDGSADLANRHPVVDRVVVVARRPGLDATVEAAVKDVPRVVLLSARRRPEPGWLGAALTALATGPIAVGPEEATTNLALEARVLRSVRLFAGGADLGEALRRARVAGFDPVDAPGMVTVPAHRTSAPAPAGPLPTQAPLPRGPRYAGTISVVLCTRDRPRQLAVCLASLARLADDDHEILVVDNHAEPTVDPATLPPRARVVHEPRRGLDIARNRGAAEAAGRVIAYIDDDCEADPGWLDGLRRAFADPEVDLVTGRVRPASLARPTHRWFESHFGFDRGLRQRRFTRWDDRPWYPLWTGVVGTGCNTAVRREVLTSLGGFDELLDVGTTIGGGGDLDLYSRAIAAGHVGEYTPHALVWHHHRDDERELARQFLGYGQAAGGYLAKAALERRGLRSAAVRCWWDRAVRLLRVARAIRAGDDPLPMRYLLLEGRGHLSGPARYAAARRGARR